MDTIKNQITFKNELQKLLYGEILNPFPYDIAQKENLNEIEFVLNRVNRLCDVVKYGDSIKLNEGENISRYIFKENSKLKYNILHVKPQNTSQGFPMHVAIIDENGKEYPIIAKVSPLNWKLTKLYRSLIHLNCKTECAMESWIQKYYNIFNFESWLICEILSKVVTKVIPHFKKKNPEIQELNLTHIDKIFEKLEKEIPCISHSYKKLVEHIYLDYDDLVILIFEKDILTYLIKEMKYNYSWNYVEEEMQYSECNEVVRDSMGYVLTSQLLTNFNSPFFINIYATHLLHSNIEEKEQDLIKKDLEFFIGNRLQCLNEHYNLKNVGIIDSIYSTINNYNVNQVSLIEHVNQSLPEFLHEIWKKHAPIKRLLHSKINEQETKIINDQLEFCKNQIRSIFAQVVLALYVSQTLYDYNHNDLHLNNIRIDNISESVNFYHDFKINGERKIYKTKSYGVHVKIIDQGRFGAKPPNGGYCGFEFEAYDIDPNVIRNYDQNTDLIYFSAGIYTFPLMPQILDLKEILNKILNCKSKIGDVTVIENIEKDMKKKFDYKVYLDSVHKAGFIDFKSKYECNSGNPKDYLEYFNEIIENTDIPKGTIVYSIPKGYIQQ